MNLRDYITQGGRGAGTALARSLGVRPVMVSQWAGGKKPVPLGRCTDIERETGGRVRRWDLRPADWHLIWPELATIPGAPQVTQREVAHG